MWSKDRLSKYRLTEDPLTEDRPINDRQPKDSHLSSQELLLSADGELPASRSAEVYTHLAACWDCRARMAEIETTIADFARAHRQPLDPQLPPVDGPRALLRAQLAELASKTAPNSWRQLFQFNSPAAALVGIAVLALLIAAISTRLFLQASARHETNSATVASETGAEPNRTLTPGATRTVAISDVCTSRHEEVIGEVSIPLRQQVLREYGIVDAHANDYEIDYLIAPGLGGVEEIGNLWPEPYASRTWNAHVKDDLEERLHQLVCGGKLDLPTAQQDIATDWIAAYKKYFNTDKPLILRSDRS